MLKSILAANSVDLRVKLISGSWEMIVNLRCDKENADKSNDVDRLKVLKTCQRLI
jgi:hypothetical protein